MRLLFRKKNKNTNDLVPIYFCRYLEDSKLYCYSMILSSNVTFDQGLLYAFLKIFETARIFFRNCTNPFDISIKKVGVVLTLFETAAFSRCVSLIVTSFD